MIIICLFLLKKAQNETAANRFVSLPALDAAMKRLLRLPKKTCFSASVIDLK